MNNLYDSKKITHYASSLLSCAGLDTEISKVVAETLVEGDLLGHDTHGLGLLASYIKEIESGGMKRQGALLSFLTNQGSYYGTANVYQVLG